MFKTIKLFNFSILSCHFYSETFIKSLTSYQKFNFIKPLAIPRKYLSKPVLHSFLIVHVLAQKFPHISNLNQRRFSFMATLR